MLGYTDAHDFQGINQWIYGRIHDPGLHSDPAISEGDWINTLFRDLTVDADAGTLTWLNVTGVESFRVYAFDVADEIDPASAVASATLLRSHDIYLPTQMNEQVTFSLSDLVPALTNDRTYYLRVQAIAPEIPVQGQGTLIWGGHSPVSLPVQTIQTVQEEQQEELIIQEIQEELVIQEIIVQKHFTMSLGSTEIINQTTGEITDMGVMPLFREGHTLVPVRFVTQALGGSANWNPAVSEVTVALDGNVLTFAIGEMLEGMDVPAQLVDNRTMVSLGFITEHFGATVLFDDTTGNIEIIM
jgi:hypothetical protein